MFKCVKLMLFSILFLLAGLSHSAPVPNDLVGIWATSDSEFEGDALVKGEAIYIDSDHLGAFVAAKSAGVIGVPIIFTSFDPVTHNLTFQFTEGGTFGSEGSIIFDPVEHVLISKPENRRFQLRKAASLSPQTRKLLGMAPKQRPTP